MKFEIKYKPSYAMLVATIDQGETITAESGALTYMTPNIEVHTRKREKSLLGSLGLTLIGGQSFWVNDYTATNGSGEAAFVAAPVGDIKQLDIAPGKRLRYSEIRLHRIYVRHRFRREMGRLH